MTRQDHLIALYKWCELRIDHFFEKEMIAWDNMERNRCPLDMAFPQLQMEMDTAIEEYCEDNGIDSEEWDIDAESVLVGY